MVFFVFQSFHSDSSHYSCLSWVSPILGWVLKCLAQGHSNEKPRGFSAARTQDPFNPLPNKPWFLRVCSTSLLKTLLEKKKLLVTSNFFFSNSVFYPLENFPPFSSYLKFASENSFGLEIYCLEKG